MKKMLSVMLAAMMLLSLLAMPALAEDTKVLTVVTWDAETTPYLKAQKEAFEASHPGVTIQYTDVAAPDWPEKAPSILAQPNDTSDVFMIKEIDQLINWQAQGYTYPLTEYIGDYDLSGFKGTEKNYAVDGVQYALPFRSDFWVLFYNKDIFDAANVEYPGNDMTWDQYAELAKKLTDEEKGIYGTHYHTWTSAVANWDVCDGVNTLADGQYDDLLYFYKLYQDLEDSGACMPYNEVKASGLKYAAAFENGNIAMLPMGYWLVSTLIGDIKAGNASLNWGIAAVPHLEGVSAGSSFGNLTGVMINNKSEQKDLAWEYISWLCGPEGAKATASVGARPAWVSEDVVDVLASVEGFPEGEGCKGALMPSYVAMEWPVVENVADIKKIVEEVHSEIVSRSISAEEGIEEMNERVADLLK